MTLSPRACQVHAFFFAHQAAQVILQGGPINLQDAAKLAQVAGEQATQIASLYDEFLTHTPAAQPTLPARLTPAAGSTATGPSTNADGTPHVWPRPSKSEVDALSLLRKLAEDPPKTLEGFVEQVAPIQAFLTAYDNAQPKI